MAESLRGTVGGSSYLGEWLTVGHNDDGTLKPDAIGGAPGNTVAFLGDSVTSAQANDTLTTQNFWSISYPSYACHLTKGRFVRGVNAGVPGNRAADMLARFSTDVASYNPSIVVIMAGTNDWNDASPTSLASYAATIKAIVAACFSIKAIPVIATVPPNILSAARRARTIAGNNWLRRYCRTNGIPLWDAYNLLVDPATGDYLAAYGSASNDKTHPINPGYAALGQDLATFLTTALGTPSITSMLPQEDGDTNNLLAHGLFLGGNTGAGATFQPTGWTVQTGSHQTGITASFVTNDTAIKGNWFQLAAAAASATDNNFQTVSGIIPGHKYAFTGRFNASGMRGADSGSGSQFLVGCAFNSVLLNNAYDFRVCSTNSYDINQSGGGVFYQEMVAPSDASTLLVRFQILNTTSGAGTLKVAQLGVYDLTALGLDGSI